MKIQTVGVKLLLVLIFYGSISFICISLLAFLCAGVLVFLKNGVFVFSWKDVIYSLKTGVAAGIPTGIGVWFMSWMKQHKESRSPLGEYPSRVQDHGVVRDQQRDDHDHRH